MEKIKVLFVIRTLLRAGAERMVVNISNELVRLGRAEVAIFTVDQGNEFEDVLDKRVLVKGGDVNFAFSIYKRNYIYNESYIDFVNTFKPTIIHSHLYYGDLLAHSYHYPNAKYFSHQHNSEVQEYNGIQLKGISKRMITDYYEFNWLKRRFKINNTKFIACSNGTYTMLDKKLNGFPKILLPNAIPLPKLNYSAKNIESYPIKLIWVGRFSDAKRPHMAIQIAHHLKQLNVHFQLKMYGIGIHLDSSKKLIDELQLAEYVQIMGVENDMDVIYSNAHLMLHTAIYEGLPMVFIEANSYGIPIVSSDCMPNNDLIQNGVNGEIVQSDDALAFANSIKGIIEDKSRYKHFSMNAIEVSKSYGIEQYVEQLLKEYQS